ncbi:MAG: DivIVA domain-containing protein [Desulfurivibrio sp.]|nr:DivIVA domain-containing protein [Desulfurivibrio sp.]
MLSANDIQSQQFHVRFRGFDVEEVDEFLEQTAATVQELSDTNAELKTRLEEAQRQVAAYQRQEKDSLSAIVSAQQVVEEMKAKARQEADEILAKARQEARELENSAGREITDLERELDSLRAMKQEVKEEVRQLLQGYLARLADDAPGAVPTTATDRTAGPAADTRTTASRAEQVASREEEDATPASGMARAAADMAQVAAADGDELYQRLELPDDWATKASREEPAPAATDAAAEEEERNLPDLDGDMIFTLEDPLDEEADDDGGPNISLDDEEEEKEPTGRH